jgi:tetratricopeptide (TPR) repeat protein
MSGFLRPLLAGLLIATGVSAGLSLDQAQSHFIEGKQHYEAQEFKQAIQQYQAILQSGYYAPELFHNLGNAFFRTGDVGRAILNYRRAKRLAPMDSAVEANIQFAQKQTGAVIPKTPIWQVPIQLVSQGTWLIGLVAAWWACMLALSAWLWTGRNAAGLKHIWVSLGCLIIVFGSGLILSAQIERKREVVVLADQVEALFAPHAGSVAHFSLPEGSLATMLEQGERWVKIRSGKDRGWIPAHTCEATIPW